MPKLPGAVKKEAVKAMTVHGVIYVLLIILVIVVILALLGVV